MVIILTYKLDEALSYSFRVFLIAFQRLIEHSAINNAYTGKYKHNSYTNMLNMLSPFNSRLMKLQDIWQVSKDNSSLVPESEGQASALLWIHSIVVALKGGGQNKRMNWILNYHAYSTKRKLKKCTILTSVDFLVKVVTRYIKINYGKDRI